MKRALVHLLCTHGITHAIFEEERIIRHERGLLRVQAHRLCHHVSGEVQVVLPFL